MQPASTFEPTSGVRFLLSDPKPYYVVDPHGEISTLRWAINVSVPQLEVETKTDPGGRITATGKPRLRDSYRQIGWVFLEELYMAEGDLEGWAQYLAWNQAREDGKVLEEFPAEWLPRECLNRKKTNPVKVKHVVPPRERKPVAQVEAQSDRNAARK